ncbi:MAG: hypothetical protein WC895_04595 [Candidatus Shapirobacteria bacterium]|jgi:hypothetical protein
MKNIPLKIESISIGLSPSINFQFKDDIEKRIFSEILTRSTDKRFLTSSQCCSNCTKYAIESIVEYRKFLVDKVVELRDVKKSTLLKTVNLILAESRAFLSVSEQYNLPENYTYLSKQLDILRQNILRLLFKICLDTKTEPLEGLFGMMNKE